MSTRIMRPQADEETGRAVFAEATPAAGVSRRGFLGRAGGVAVATVAAGSLGGLPLPGVAGAAPAAAALGTPLEGRARADQAFAIRTNTARNQRIRPIAAHPVNGDETAYPSRIGSYSRCLPHNALGEVDPAAYNAFLRALASGSNADFEAIPMAGTNKQSEPRGAYMFALEGPDSHCLYTDPPPAFSSAAQAADIAEVYWQALTRDIPFANYDAAPLIAQAAADLSRFSAFPGPKQGGVVTPATLFRGPTPGDLIGPYVSQFLLAPVAYGAMTFQQRYQVAPPTDYLTSYDAWLANLRGGLPKPKPVAPGAPPPPTRYICTGRDLATYFHADFNYQAYLNASLILLAMGAPLDASNPYRKSLTQKNNGPTFGSMHVLDLIARTTIEAVKASWYQKWLVHRRLRPEVFGGRVHNRKIGAADYPIHPDLLERSAALELVYRRHGTYLLPVAFPEGSPTHPSYPASHVAIAAACVTVLKAFFDESFVLPEPVVASADGAELVPYSGAPLTVGNELNKLAYNVAMGRDFGGVHWRTDGAAAVLLGEAVALGVMTDQANTYPETFKGFSLTRFDGTTITV